MVVLFPSELSKEGQNKDLKLLEFPKQKTEIILYWVVGAGVVKRTISITGRLWLYKCNKRNPHVKINQECCNWSFCSVRTTVDVVSLSPLCNLPSVDIIDWALGGCLLTNIVRGS